MQAGGELLIWIAWRVMPGKLRIAIATKIATLQARCLEGVPRSIICAAPPQTAAVSTNYPRYSLLTTCYNEAESISEFLDSALRQTVPPAELVITDGGSTDQTVDRIRAWEQSHSGCGFPLVVISGARLNIAEGRNRAASQAVNHVFLFADAGTTLDRRWAEKLLEPFACDSECEVSMGWYKAITTNPLQAALAEYILTRSDALDPETFLPSARSLAVSRGAFMRAGGFPEYLTRSGEDTLFDYFLKSAARRWAFAPEALAFWKMPERPLALFKMVAAYAQGDAESPVLFNDYYLRLLATVGTAALEFAAALALTIFTSGSSLLLGKILALFFAGSGALRISAAVLGYRPPAGSTVPLLPRICAVSGMILAQTAGFVRGLRRRQTVERRRLALAKRGTVVLLIPRALGAFSGQVEHREVGELLADGWDIVAVSAAGPPAQDQYSTLYAHANLSQYVRGAFDPSMWWQHMQRLNRSAIFVTDRCQEAWAKELTAALLAHGAHIR